MKQLVRNQVLSLQTRGGAESKAFCPSPCVVAPVPPVRDPPPLTLEPAARAQSGMRFLPEGLAASEVQAGRPPITLPACPVPYDGSPGHLRFDKANAPFVPFPSPPCSLSTGQLHLPAVCSTFKIQRKPSPCSAGPTTTGLWQRPLACIPSTCPVRLSWRASSSEGRPSLPMIQVPLLPPSCPPGDL